MANIDPRFVILPPIQETLFDKDLATFLAGGMVYFYEDDNRTTPKAVYELSGSYAAGYTYVQLPNPLILSSIGTFVDPSGNPIIPYLFPFEGSPTDVPFSNVTENYFIQVYSSTGVHQFDIQAWPNVASSGFDEVQGDTTDNILANPQFVQVLFNTQATSANPVVISTTGVGTVTNLAPDWDMVTTGTGSFSVYQNPISDTSAISNPPYALAIVASTGYSSMILRQRLYNSPRLFAGLLVSGYFVAEALDGIAHTLSMNYVPSATGTPELICTGTTATSGFTAISNATAVLITPANTGAPPAYVDITIPIPVGAQLQISSIQLCGVASVNESLTFLQQPTARQIDHLFHYYQQELIVKPKDTIVSGWDFPLNPWQYTTTTLTNVATNAYTADQTIVIQQEYVSTATGNNVSVGEATAAYRAGFEVNAVTTTNQFGLLQYIDPKTTEPYWSYYLSSLARLLYIPTSTPTPPQFKMRLLVCTSFPATEGVTQTYPVASWVAGKDPAFGANITALVPLNDPVYTLGTAGFEGTNSFPSYSFDQFLLPTNTAGQVLGIFLYTISNMTASDKVIFDSISLVPNRFAVDTNPKTYDTVLKECQFYYELSNINVANLTANPTVNSLFFDQTSVAVPGSTVTNGYSAPFTISYKNIKRTAAPTTTIFSANTGGTSGQAFYKLWYQTAGSAFAIVTQDASFAGFWSASSAGNSSITYIPNTLSIVAQGTTSNTSVYSSSGVQLQYTCDARLGIVA